MGDWTETLSAFKREKGATAPLSYRFDVEANKNIFTGAFKTSMSFFTDGGGNVKFGPIEPEYRDYLAYMKKWYDDGLLDKNISTVDGRLLDTNVLTGKTGATVGYAGSALGKWMDAMGGDAPGFKLAGISSPVLNKGDRPWYGQKDFKYVPGNSAAISRDCKTPELAAKFMDYAYSGKGHFLFNFGVEGESYEMADGKPKYTELITKNENNLSMAHALGLYTMTYGGPFVQDRKYIEQYYSMPEQLEAIKAWADSDAGKHAVPFIEMLPEEASENARIMNDLVTYTNEMHLRFIMGIEPLGNFDKYVAQCKAYGVDTVLKSRQSALERYNKR
jgi:putative aldouronate transport system substrate-binding protein